MFLRIILVASFLMPYFTFQFYCIPVFITTALSHHVLTIIFAYVEGDGIYHYECFLISITRIKWVIGHNHGVSCCKIIDGTMSIITLWWKLKVCNSICTLYLYYKKCSAFLTKTVAYKLPSQEFQMIFSYRDSHSQVAKINSRLLVPVYKH